MSTSGSCKFRFLVAGLRRGAAARPPPRVLRGTSRHSVPGAPGVGDSYYPTYGNGGYDVGHYDLESPTTRRRTASRARRRSGRRPPKPMQLQPRPRRARSAQRRGQRQAGNMDSQRTRAHRHPAAPPRKRRRFQVEVRYDGVPVEFVLPGFDPPIRTGFMATPDGANVIGQPEVAASWFPVNDHPIDKASYSFDVTVPDGYEVVANGFLRDRDHRGAGQPGSGRPASRWRRTSPRSTSGTGTSTGGTPTAGYRSTTRSTRRSPAACARRSTPRSRGRVRSSTCLTDAFGPYPFSTVGGIVDNQDDLFFALETQTRPVYSKLFWLDSRATRPTATSSSSTSSPTSGSGTT